MPLRKLLRRPDPAAGIFHWFHTFTLHVVTGFVAVAVHYSAMYALVEAGVAAVPASAAGFVLGAMTRFATSYLHIFAPTRSASAAGVRFIVVFALQLGANSALLALLLAQDVPLWPAQVATTIVLTFGNYLAYRLWVFR